jgi:hypothetical protein
MCLLLLLPSSSSPPSLQPFFSIFAVRLPLRDFDECSQPRDLYDALQPRASAQALTIFYLTSPPPRIPPLLRHLLIVSRLSFEIDSNEVMDEHFPVRCTPDSLLPLLRNAPEETQLDPGIYGQITHIYLFVQHHHHHCHRLRHHHHHGVISTTITNTSATTHRLPHHINNFQAQPTQCRSLRRRR